MGRLTTPKTAVLKLSHFCVFLISSLKHNVALTQGTTAFFADIFFAFSGYLTETFHSRAHELGEEDVREAATLASSCLLSMAGASPPNLYPPEVREAFARFMIDDRFEDNLQRQARRWTSPTRNQLVLLEYGILEAISRG